MKFVPGLGPKKTVASVTAAFQKAINDLLHIEQQQNAEYDLVEKQIARLEDEQTQRMTEAEKAAKVRLKLEGLLN